MLGAFAIVLSHLCFCVSLYPTGMLACEQADSLAFTINVTLESCAWPHPKAEATFTRLIFDGLQKVKLFGPISCYASHFFSIGCMRQVLLPSDLRVSKLVTPPGHDAV